MPRNEEIGSRFTCTLVGAVFGSLIFGSSVGLDMRCPYISGARSGGGDEPSDADD